jgi:hypothetical protein
MGGICPLHDLGAGRELSITYRGIGIAAAGSWATGGTHLIADVAKNEITSAYTNTGDTNPAGLRVSPAITAGGTAPGFVQLILAGNEFRGTHKYGIIIYGGMPRRGGGTFTGQIEATLTGNHLDPGTVAPALVTFTHARATVFPCELDPATQPCPTVMTANNQPLYWTYLTDALFDIRYQHELDNALIDHPQLHPVDGSPLNNLLMLNNDPAPYCSFFGVCGSPVSLSSRIADVGLVTSRTALRTQEQAGMK